MPYNAWWWGEFVGMHSFSPESVSPDWLHWMVDLIEDHIAAGASRTEVHFVTQILNRLGSFHRVLPNDELALDAIVFERQLEAGEHVTLRSDKRQWVWDEIGGGWHPVERD